MMAPLIRLNTVWNIDNPNDTLNCIWAILASTGCPAGRLPSKMLL